MQLIQFSPQKPGKHSLLTFLDYEIPCHDSTVCRYLQQYQMASYTHLLSPSRRLARAIEGYEANLRNVRSLNLNISGESELEASRGPVLIDPSFKEFHSSVDAMTSSLAHLRSPILSSARKTGELGAAAIGGASELDTDSTAAVSLPMPPVAVTESADERVSIIVSLQDEVERLERQLLLEREARRKLEDQVCELQRRGEEEDEEDGGSKKELLKENAVLKEKLVRATRVLARLRFRRKEQELLQ